MSEKSYKLVEDKHEQAFNSLSRLFKKFNKIEDAYFGFRKSLGKNSESNVFDPIVYEIVEHTASHQFAQLPEGTFFPVEPSDTFQTEIANELVSWQMRKPIQNARKKFILAGKTAFLYGYAPAITYWRYERTFNKALNKWVTKWDDPCFEIPSIYDCWFDVDAPNWNSLSYFGYDEYITVDDLIAQNNIMQGEKRYINLQTLKDKVKNGGSNNSNRYRSNALDNKGIKSDDSNSDKLLVRHYFDKNKWISIVPDYSIVIEDRSNPYPFDLPVDFLIDQDFPNIPIGIGEVEPILSLATAQNQFLNMRMDNIKNILEPPVKAKHSALQHSQSWLFKRNQIWVVNDQNDVETIGFPDVTANTFAQTNNLIESTILKRQGRSDFRSQSTLDNKTATEVKAMVGEQNARQRYKELNIDDFVSGIYTKFLQLDQMYLSRERLVRVVGSNRVQRLHELYGDDVTEEVEKTNEYGALEKVREKSPKAGKFDKSDDELGWLKVNKEDIASMFDFRVESGSTKALDVSTEVSSLQQSIKLLNDLRPTLQEKGQDIDLMPLVKDLLRSLKIKNVDKVFVSLESMQNPQIDNLLNEYINGQSQQQDIQGGSPETTSGVSRGVPQAQPAPRVPGV